MRSFIVSGLLIICVHVHSQPPLSIKKSEVTRIEKTLAADDMQGRQVFTPGIEKAAAFIAKEFKEAGLKPLKGSNDFRQSFTVIDPFSTEEIVTLNGSSVDRKNVIAITADSLLTITPDDHYKEVFINKISDFNEVINEYQYAEQNILIFVDTSFAKKFAKLAKHHTVQLRGSGNRIYILTALNPQQYRIQIKQKIEPRKLTNMVGMIPGKSKPEQYVIFSAHYDHLGIGKPDAAGDSIYNGANDDASGITAVITLANYFRQLNNNERTIIFAAFTAEEIGESGSAYFSKKLDPAKVMAMLNIEMIGTESKWGKNSAYITGYDKTDMGTMLQKNLMNSQFKFYPDPYPEQMLFLRSDNATLAKRGIPAHTISTSKMDSEKYYHKQGDEVKTLDLDNMTQIIQAIGLSAGSIIAGKDTPKRIKPE